MASSITAGGLSFKLTSSSQFPSRTIGTAHLRLPRVAREVPPTSLSNSTNEVVFAPKSTTSLEKDARALWKRYVDWLYQHKELGLYLDVSRVGFTDEFFQEMEPRLHKALKDMEELEKGAIANPDEGRMVGHYWLRNPKLAPKAILTQQIESTLVRICDFAEQVISGKVSSYYFLIQFLDSLFLEHD